MRDAMSVLIRPVVSEKTTGLMENRTYVFVIDPKATKVGTRAQTRSRPPETPPGNHGAKMDWPAGFGALARTVSPPPAKAPAITACLKDSAWAPGAMKSGTWAAK